MLWIWKRLKSGFYLWKRGKGREKYNYSKFPNKGTIKVQQNVYILCWGIFKHIPHLTVVWVIQTK